MRDLVSGVKKSIKCEEVKVFQVPQYDVLKVDNMLEFAKDYPAAIKHLPTDMKEIKKMPRNYISNVLYTVIGEPFRSWVYTLMEQRNRDVAFKDEDYAQLDPEIYALFKNSN